MKLQQGSSQRHNSSHHYRFEEDSSTTNNNNNNNNKNNYSGSFSPIQRAFVIYREQIPSSSPRRKPVSTRAYNPKDYEYIVSFPRPPPELNREDALLQYKFYKYGMGYGLSSANFYEESCSHGGSNQRLNEDELGSSSSSQMQQKSITLRVEHNDVTRADAQFHEMEANVEPGNGCLRENRNCGEIYNDNSRSEPDELKKSHTSDKVFSDIRLSKVHPYGVGIADVPNIGNSSSKFVIKKEAPGFEKEEGKDRNMSSVVQGTSRISIEDRDSDSGSMRRPNVTLQSYASSTALDSYYERRMRNRALPSLKEEAYMTVFERHRRRTRKKNNKRCEEYGNESPPETSTSSTVDVKLNSADIRMPSPTNGMLLPKANASVPEFGIWNRREVTCQNETYTRVFDEVREQRRGGRLPEKNPIQIVEAKERGLHESPQARRTLIVESRQLVAKATKDGDIQERKASIMNWALCFRRSHFREQ